MRHLPVLQSLKMRPLQATLFVVAVTAQTVPTPISFWTFQEETGAPRVSTAGLEPYQLVDGNSSSPVQRVDGGVFGSYSAYFPVSAANSSMRLYAAREDVPLLTRGISGPHATVTTIAWIRRSVEDAKSPEAMVAGVWNEHAAARQYALFTDLGACSTAPVYQGGLASHISDTGGPTPGNRYCITRACDPGTLPPNAWHCLAGVYDGQNIWAYVNGTFHPNNNATVHDNPFTYPGGIFSPEAHGAAGAEFGVGANTVNKTVGGPVVWSNHYVGQLGGLAVWNSSLTQAQVASVCASAHGFDAFATLHGVQPWNVAVVSSYS